MCEKKEEKKRKKKKKRQTDRQTYTERDNDRERETETETDRQTDRERERESFVMDMHLMTSLEFDRPEVTCACAVDWTFIQLLTNQPACYVPYRVSVQGLDTFPLSLPSAKPEQTCAVKKLCVQ